MGEGGEEAGHVAVQQALLHADVRGPPLPRPHVPVLLLHLEHELVLSELAALAAEHPSLCGKLASSGVDNIIFAIYASKHNISVKELFI